MKNNDLLFENLYLKCINEWPYIINVNIKSETKQTVENHPDGYQLIKCDYGEWNGNIENYIVYIDDKIEISDFCDEIVEKYFDADNGVICENIHYSIQNAIYKQAVYTDCIESKNIRKKYVKIKFEEKIIYFISKYYADKENSLWDISDIKWAIKYFRVNYPEGHPVLEPKKIS
ncbi:MAG: hypothetical protein CNLJKLNK_01357 [Holosporales bacterium]